jgi:hypothetical protein
MYEVFEDDIVIIFFNFDNLMISLGLHVIDNYDNNINYIIQWIIL